MYTHIAEPLLLYTPGKFCEARKNNKRRRTHELGTKPRSSPQCLTSEASKIDKTEVEKLLLCSTKKDENGTKHFHFDDAFLFHLKLSLCAQRKSENEPLRWK